MDLLNTLKTENVLEKFDNFLGEINKSDTPILVNSSYEFTDSICENETMEDRTDIFAFYNQFASFRELLYPPLSLLSSAESPSKDNQPPQKNPDEADDSTTNTATPPAPVPEKLRSFQEQNAKSRELISKPVPEQIWAETDLKPQFSGEDLSGELSKIGHQMEPLDLVYFFDLLLSKSARFFYKEPIPNMFYDNIFVHNTGEPVPGRSNRQ